MFKKGALAVAFALTVLVSAHGQSQEELRISGGREHLDTVKLTIDVDQEGTATLELVEQELQTRCKSVLKHYEPRLTWNVGKAFKLTFNAAKVLIPAPAVYRFAYHETGSSEFRSMTEAWFR